MKNFDKSGIYKITNLINDKIYIGSTIHFKKRWDLHKSQLKRQKHKNTYLQNVYNKYGKDNFKFEILAICPKEYLIKMEQWFIDNMKPEYNICKIAGRTIGIKKSQIQIDKHIKSLCKYYYKILTPDKSIIIIDNLAKFCKEFKLNVDNIFNRGKSKGFHILETSSPKVNISNMLSIGESISLANTGKKHSKETLLYMKSNWNKYIYIIKHIDGSIFNVSNLTDFCKEKNLNIPNLVQTFKKPFRKDNITPVYHKKYKIISKEIK